MKVNLHAHTVRCGHATGTEREYIEEALRIGMTDFGFSDHTPMPFPDDYESTGMRMRMDEMDDYADTILHHLDCRGVYHSLRFIGLWNVHRYVIGFGVDSVQCFDYLYVLVQSKCGLD